MDDKPRRGRTRLLIAFLFLGQVLALGFYLWVCSLPEKNAAEALPEGPFPERLSPSDLAYLSDSVRRTLDSPVALPGRGDGLLAQQKGAIYLALRRDGVLLGDIWCAEPGATWEQNLQTAVGRLAKHLPDYDTGAVTLVEVFLPTGYTTVDPATLGSLKLEAGRQGLALTYGSSADRFAPTWMISQGLSFERTKNVFLSRQGQDPRATLRKPLQAQLISGYQALVSVTDGRAVELYRANELAPEKLTEKELGRLAEGLRGWMLAHVDALGRSPYGYRPLNNQDDSKGEVQVRNWLGTWSLARASGAAPKDAALAKAYHDNCAYFLRHTYRTDGLLGWVEELDGSICLGSISVAGLAMADGPERPAHRRLEDSLFETTRTLWHPDGSFSSYLRPKTKNAGQDFYPGEALLFWAARYERQPDPRLLERMMTSFRYYRAYHLKDRKGAFVPWQTQAACRVFKLTHDPWLKEFVFDMNDWLVGQQIWDGEKVAPDMKGQFLPPDVMAHISSTGVYLEGLAYALELARASGDKARASRYQESIERGLRHLYQHQYNDLFQAFFAARVDRTIGGLRSTLVDATIRIDNMGHALNAIITLRHLGVVPDR